MSYSGEGEHSRLATSADTTSPTDRIERALRGNAPSTVSLTFSSRRKCSTSNSGPTLRRVPAIGGSNLANDPASASSCPESLSASLRPRFATTRCRTLPCSSRYPSTSCKYVYSRPDRLTLVSLTNMLPQHYRPHRTANNPHRINSCHNSIHHETAATGANPHAASQTARTNHHQPRKMGLAVAEALQDERLALARLERRDSSDALGVFDAGQGAILST